MPNEKNLFKSNKETTFSSDFNNNNHKRNCEEQQLSYVFLHEKRAAPKTDLRKYTSWTQVNTPIPLENARRPLGKPYSPMFPIDFQL